VDRLKAAVAPLAQMGLTEQNATAALDVVKALGKGDVAGALGQAQAALAPLEQKLGVNGQDAQALIGFARSLANGDVGQALQGLGTEAAKLTGSPELQRAMGYVNDGAAVVGALQQGRFSGALERLGAPARDVDAVRQAEGLLRALQAGDLGALAKTAPAQQLLQGAQALAQKLGGGQAVDAFQRFQGALQQLRAAAAPGFDLVLRQQANQLLALAAKL